MVIYKYLGIITGSIDSKTLFDIVEVVISFPTECILKEDLMCFVDTYRRDPLMLAIAIFIGDGPDTPLDLSKDRLYDDVDVETIDQNRLTDTTELKYYMIRCKRDIWNQEYLILGG